MDRAARLLHHPQRRWCLLRRCRSLRPTSRTLERIGSDFCPGDTLGVAPSPLSFPARRPIFALDRIFGWPHGLIEDRAIHDTPLSRVSSDHLPLTARVSLAAARARAAA